GRSPPAPFPGPPVGHRAVRRLEESNLREGRKVGFELFPYPDCDVLRGRVLESLVDILVVKTREDLVTHRALEEKEVESHSGLRIDRHLQGDVQLVAVPVEVEAGPLIAGEAVGGLESEPLGDHHRRIASAFSSQRGTTWRPSASAPSRTTLSA